MGRACLFHSGVIMSIRQRSNPKTIAELRALQEKTSEVRARLETAKLESELAKLEESEERFVPFSDLPGPEKAVLTSIEIAPSPDVAINEDVGATGGYPYGIALALVLIGFLFLIRRL